MAFLQPNGTQPAELRNAEVMQEPPRTCWCNLILCCSGSPDTSSPPSCRASKSTVCLWGHVGGVVGVSGNGVLVSIFSPILYLSPLSTLDDQSRAQAPASHAPALGGDAGEGQADCAAQAGMEVIVASVVISFLHGALISSFFSLLGEVLGDG